MALVVALLGLGTAFVRQWLQVKLASPKLDTVTDLARLAVAAAEKVGEGMGIKGPEKYAYAEMALTTAAKRVGVKLKTEEVNMLIHSVLAELEGFEVPEVAVAQTA